MRADQRGNGGTAQGGREDDGAIARWEGEGGAVPEIMLEKMRARGASRATTSSGVVKNGYTARTSTKPPPANAFAQSASITVSVPESVEIKFVDASALGDYEVWVLLTSVLASAVTGFLVAVVQAPGPEQPRYVAITTVFGILDAISAVMVIVTRRRLSRRTRRAKFRVGDPVQDDVGA